MSTSRLAVAADGLPDPGQLRAVTDRLGAPGAGFDPLVLAADRGHLVVGRSGVVAGLGVAAVLSLPRGLSDPDALAGVTAWLAAVPHDAPPGTAGAPGPVAVGAFPFDPGAPATLVVPRTTYWRGPDGSARVVRTGRRDDPGLGDGGWEADEAVLASALDPRRVTTDNGAPGSPAVHAGAGGRSPVASLHPVPDGGAYADAVRDALGDISAGRLRKVVLGRMVELRMQAMPSPSAVLRRLWGGERVFSPFSVPIGGARLVGASPELLVGRRGHEVLSHAFAGTVALSGPLDDTAAADRLWASSKDREEHRFVVEEIAAALGRRCTDLTVPHEPSVVRLRSDARLGTLIRGVLRGAPATAGGAPAVDDSALAILSDLHPTPAVGGVPRRRALERIIALEGAPRGYWAGPVGWVDARGDGEWILAIRSATVAGNVATVHAGAGIVAGSDPEAELAETTVKLSPVLESLCPGASRLL